MEVVVRPVCQLTAPLVPQRSMPQVRGREPERGYTKLKLFSRALSSLDMGHYGEHHVFDVPFTTELQTRLRAQYNSIGFNEIDVIFIPCICLKCPPRWRHFRENYDIMKDIVFHPKFAPIL